MSVSQNLAGYDIATREYFSHLRFHIGLPLRFVTRSAFCQARQKLSWRAFEFLLNELNQKLELARTWKKWKGHRVQATDGMRLTLPCSENIKSSLPQHKKGKKHVVHYPTAILITSFDLLSGTFLKAKLGTYKASERGTLVEFLKTFRPGDLHVVDRGFEGFALMCEILKQSQNFLIRVRAQGKMPDYAKAFLKTKRASQTIQLEGKNYAGKNKIIKIRLVRDLSWKGLEPVVLVTNLTNEEKYSTQELIHLYSKRWKIETSFNRIKHLFHLENFHSRSVNGVLQEIFSSLFCLSLTASLVFLSSKHLKKEGGMLKIRPNFKAALSCLKESFFILIWMERVDIKIQAVFEDLESQIRSIKCQKQPGRHYPRVSKQPQNKWQMTRPRKLAEHKKLLKVLKPRR